MDIKELLQFVKDEKTKSYKMIEEISLDIRDHIICYGENTCDYLIERREKLKYYQGYWNALNSVHRNIEC